MPCVISPYHLRIDWLMWFAAFQNYQVFLSFFCFTFCLDIIHLIFLNDKQCPWLIHLVDKILSGDPTVNMLLGEEATNNNNPFFHSIKRSVSSQKNYNTSIKQSSIQGQPPTYVRAMLYEVITTTMNF